PGAPGHGSSRFDVRFSMFDVGCTARRIEWFAGSVPFFFVVFVGFCNKQDIPMSETVLSISLLNERLSATAVHRGSAVGNWEHPEPLPDLADFASVLRDAARQTHY